MHPPLRDRPCCKNESLSTTISSTRGFLGTPSAIFSIDVESYDRTRSESNVLISRFDRIPLYPADDSSHYHDSRIRVLLVGDRLYTARGVRIRKQTPAVTWSRTKTERPRCFLNSETRSPNRASCSKTVGLPQRIRKSPENREQAFSFGSSCHSTPFHRSTRTPLHPPRRANRRFFT